MQRKMECVYMVYKTGSFSKAAEMIFASQSSISMSVSRVEEELGYKLFDRSTHPLQLTEAGKLYLAHIERTIRSEETLLRDLVALSASSKKHLKIGCIPLHARYLIPNVLSRFRELDPDIEISVVSLFPGEMQQKLRENVIDIALSPMRENVGSELNCIPALQVQLLIAVPEGDPVNDRLCDFALSGTDVRQNAHRRPGMPRVPLSVFSDTPFITMDTESDFHELFRRLFDENDFSPSVVFFASAPAAAYDMARAGLGATITDHLSIDPDAPLKYYCLRSRQDERSFYFMLRRDNAASPVVRLFIETFQNHLTV